MNTKKTILVIAVIFLLFAVSFSGTVLVGQLSENKQIFKVNIPSKSDDDEKTEVTKKTSENKKEKSTKDTSASEKATQKGTAKEKASQTATSGNTDQNNAENNVPQNNSSQEDNSQVNDNHEEPEVPEVPPESTTNADSGSSSSAVSSVPDSRQNDALSMILSDTGHSFDELQKNKCSQLIIVESNYNTAQLSMFEKDKNGIWNNIEELETSGYVGAAGVSDKSFEGSWQTPKGLFPVGEAFYIHNKPTTGLESFEITQDIYWVDDPNSAYYNQKVDLKNGVNMDWNSAEHMIDIQNYEYGFVINFNMSPIEKGKGSAIFFHISSSPTAGCVGTSQEMVLEYLKVLDKDKNPYILTF